MIGKTGLLIVSNPNKIGRILSTVRQQVKSTLYIQLLSALGEPFGSYYPNLFNTWPKYSQTIFGIYSQAATHCKDLDVKVLLSGIKYNITKIQTPVPIDLIIFDKNYSKPDIDNFVSKRIENLIKDPKVLTVDTGDFEIPKINNEDCKLYKHTVLGGTFDRLHIAHKLLLSEAVLRSTDKVTVGVTEENMLTAKTLWELVEPINTRVKNVQSFLQNVCPELTYDVVPISDPFGPSIVDPTMEMIVVSEETIKGGQKINDIRLENQLTPLDIHTVELIDEPNPNPLEENKISSSTQRMRLLGTVLNPIKPNEIIPKKPYVIGLTGGIASGKSNIADNLEQLGAQIINCDLIGHSVYKAGKPCFTDLVKHFGESIVGADGEVDRKKLGPIVFKDPKELESLNQIVWPWIEAEVKEEIKNSKANVVVIEAAVLLTAGWERNCHEVWTTLIPKEEAIRRLKNRNNLTEEQARNRIESQSSNSDYVHRGNVIFCTLWPKEYTKQQVVRAWDLLQARIPT